MLVATTLRITDRDNDVGAGGGSDPATVTDVPLEVPADCTPTAGTQSGATCALTTTVDSVIPGAVKERDRSIWQLGRIELRDAGPNGTGYGSGVPAELRGRRRSSLHAAGSVHSVVASRSAVELVPAQVVPAS